MTKIFIDGESGTTGLMIHGLLGDLAAQSNIEFLHIEKRRDIEQRREALNQADIVVLCLPDDAARQAITLLEPGSKTRVLDASSAHRTQAPWVYGFPELSDEQPRLIATADRVTNPGCYAIGTIAILKPLIDAGIVQPDDPLVVQGISGYSGDGKETIRKFKTIPGYDLDNAFNLYALNRRHKHVPEMTKYSGLAREPIFVPGTIALEQGMQVIIPLRIPSTEAAHETLSTRYNRAGSQVNVLPLGATKENINTARFADVGGNPEKLFPGMVIHVTGYRSDENHTVIVAEFDNLGKGAAAQAVQNLKLMLG